ncbi:MAG: class I SAM-dependent methyltransferase [Patescibacteria group bacterium]|nr:class I SAM-dependent methyltransferase [Patescibacteria group bacterium]
MERSAFEHLLKTENQWWNRGRAYAVCMALSRAAVTHYAKTLDYGAGFGAMYGTLKPVSGELDAFEIDDEACAGLSQRGYAHVYMSESETYHHRYDLVAFFDVLEHLEDDAATLARTREALTQEGRIVLTVPAMPFLWSGHDVEHHHFRRYTARSLRSLLEQEGFEIEYLRYWNVALFIPAAVMRPLGASGDASFTSSRLIDSLLYALIVVETWIVRFVPLPFGISLVAVAHKK